MNPIYFDYNATSLIRPEVKNRVQGFLREEIGNPSSLHQAGRQVRAHLEVARGELLEMLGDSQGQLIFTSGGTEADNLALRGTVQSLAGLGRHIIVSSLEHNAVLQTAQALEAEGWRVTYIPTDYYGVIDPKQVEEAIGPETVLISVMHANNEVGTIQPIEQIGHLAREKGILFHTDAVQSFGKLPLDVSKIPVDLVSLSGHKLGGLKGCGALYARQGVRLSPILYGGPHEHGLRAGTEPVTGIIAMTEAARVCHEQLQAGEPDRLRVLRDRLETELRNKLPDTHINGHPAQRLPHTLNLSFTGCDGETLLMALDMQGICVSTGSACSSGSSEPSHVLVAMNLPKERIRSSIRLSLGWGTTAEEIDEAIRRIVPVVERIRSAAPKAC